MKIVLNGLLLVVVLSARVLVAADLPDPMKDPGSKGVVEAEDLSEVTVQGVVLGPDHKNSIILNNKAYMVGNMFNQDWQVVEITQQQVKLVNSKTKKDKVIILGE
jgi:hypothetical protein